MYSVGVTQELAHVLGKLERQAEDQMDQIASVYRGVSRLKPIISALSDDDAELRTREVAAKVEIAKNCMEMEILHTKNEEEYAETTRASEKEQTKRSEELTLERLKRGDEAARL